LIVEAIRTIIFVLKQLERMRSRWSFGESRQTESERQALDDVYGFLKEKERFVNNRF